MADKSRPLPTNPSAHHGKEKLKLRAYREADFTDLHRIDAACFAPGICYTPSELREFLTYPDAFTRIAEIGGNIVGFVIAYLELPGLGHIVTLDVLSEWRRRRVGMRLMDATEEWLRKREARLVYLETAEDNHTAQRFYQARGFRTLHKIARYYADGNSALLMGKSLLAGPPAS